MYKYASTPENLSSSKAIPLFNSHSYAPPAKYNLNEINPSSKEYFFFMEPGAIAHDKVLYLALQSVPFPPTKPNVFLISSEDYGETWRYIAPLVNSEDAQRLGYDGLTALSLAEENGKLFLLTSPIKKVKFPVPHLQYTGIYAFEFDDITAGKLKRNIEGDLIVVKYIPPIDITSVGGGQSDYHELNHYGGVIMAQSFPLVPKERFQIYSTKQRIADEEVYKPPIAIGYGPGDHNFSLIHDGLTRTYKVHVPSSYNAKISTPVVMYFHGGGGSIQAAFKDGVDKYSDKFGFILAVPAGTGPIPSRLLTWNGGKWPPGKGTTGFESCCGYASKNNVDDVGFISQMIEEVKRNFNVDENRIYATGISNGGIMSYRLACEIADKIAAIAPVAPPAVPLDCAPSKPVPVMHIHGTADPCAPYGGGTGGGCLGSEKYEMQSAKDMVNIWKNINKCSDDSTIVYQNGDATCISYNKCGGGSGVKLCTIEGGGHTWPSGSQYLPEKNIGPVSYETSFNQIWKFFKKHSLSANRICVRMRVKRGM